MFFNKSIFGEDKKVEVSINMSSVFMAIAVIALVYILYLLRDLLLLVFAAVVVASAIQPITKRLIRLKIPRVMAVVIIYISIVFILLGSFYFLVIPLVSETSGFISNIPNYIESIEVWNPVKDVPIFSSSLIGNSLSDISKSFPFIDLSKKFESIFSNLSGGFLATVSTIFGGIVGIVLIVVLSFYLSVQENGIANFLRMICPIKYRHYVVDLWRRSETKIGLWMQGQLLLSLLIGFSVFLGLSLLGIKHALILGVLAGIFELIPVFGPIFSAVPGIALGLASGGLSMALIVTVFYIIVQQFENHLIYPLVVKKVVGVSPLIVILSLVIGAELAGFLGVLLSVPASSIIIEFMRDLEKNRDEEESKLEIKI